MENSQWPSLCVCGNLCYIFRRVWHMTFLTSASVVVPSWKDFTETLILCALSLALLLKIVFGHCVCSKEMPMCSAMWCRWGLTAFKELINMCRPLEAREWCAALSIGVSHGVQRRDNALVSRHWGYAKLQKMLKQWHFFHSMETQPVVFDSITIIPRGRIGLFNFFFPV